MNEGQIRAELEAVKAALSQPTADIADLQARVDSASSSLVMVLHGGRRKPRMPLQEYDLRELIALWSEVKAALKARAAGRALQPSSWRVHRGPPRPEALGGFARPGATPNRTSWPAPTGAGFFTAAFAAKSPPFVRSTEGSWIGPEAASKGGLAAFAGVRAMALRVRAWLRKRGVSGGDENGQL